MCSVLLHWFVFVGYVFDDYLKPGQVRFIVCLDIFWTENASEVLSEKSEGKSGLLLVSWQGYLALFSWTGLGKCGQGCVCASVKFHWFFWLAGLDYWKLEMQCK